MAEISNQLRRYAPLWLMGMSNMTLGLFGGFLFVPLPQMLAAQGVPEGYITAIVATCLSPGFWGFALGPLLDVRFSRRWYATLFAILAGIIMAASILSQHHMRTMETLLTIGYASAMLSSNALGGWLGTIVRREDEAQLSAWTQVGSYLGYALMAVLPGELSHVLPPSGVAPLLGTLVVLPAIIFLWMPVPLENLTQAKRLAESFGAFGRELLALFKRREVLIALPLFLLPTGSFAMTNNLGGIGQDFHASPQFVSRISALMQLLAGAFGCLMLPLLAKKIRILPLYFVVGIVGALFTMSLLALPHAPATFATAILGENIFQALSFSTAVAITFDTIGRNNPLAATQFGLLTSATALPISYMGALDGWAYGHGGLRGELRTDALISLAACVALLPLVRLMRRG